MIPFLITVCQLSLSNRFAPNLELEATLNRSATGVTLQQLDSLSVYDCALICWQDAKCSSFNFNRKSTVCELKAGCTQEISSNVDVDYWK